MGSISTPQGKGSQMHNMREYEKYGKPLPNNIDPARTPENVVLVNKDFREAYKEIFGDALAEYNAKQKRADRKIKDYFAHIQKSKNGEKLFYEDVVQWGSKEDFKDEVVRQKAKQALTLYALGFEERNPQLKVLGAYIHMDEASPHLHIDYVPVASGYKRGLRVRNSLDKAMKQMGFVPEQSSRQNNATKLWKERERAVFADICRSLGLEVDAEREARGSLSVDEYKIAKDKMVGEIEQERDELTAEVEQLTVETEQLTAEKQKLGAEVRDLSEQRDVAKSDLAQEIAEDAKNGRKEAAEALQEFLTPVREGIGFSRKTVYKATEEGFERILDVYAMHIAALRRAAQAQQDAEKAREEAEKKKREADEKMREAEEESKRADAAWQVVRDEYRVAREEYHAVLKERKELEEQLQKEKDDDVLESLEKLYPELKPIVSEARRFSRMSILEQMSYLGQRESSRNRDQEIEVGGL